MFYIPNPGSSQGRDLLLSEGSNSSEVDRDSCSRIFPFPRPLPLCPSRDTATPSQLPAGAGGVEFGFLKDIEVLDLEWAYEGGRGLGQAAPPERLT